MMSKMTASTQEAHADGKGPNGRKKLEKVVDAIKLGDAPFGIETCICSTCCHKETCLFLRASRLPIYQCEEFSDSSG